MSMWGFTHEKNVDDAAANTVAGYYAGMQPMSDADSVASKRNVIATDAGWVRRIQYIDVHNNLRTKDEVLIAAHPGLGGSGGYTNTVNLGPADIGLVQLQGNTASGVSTFSNSASMTVYVTFNEPLISTSNVEMTITSRDEGTTFVLTSNTTNAVDSKAKILSPGANNTLVFEGVPADGVKAGNYKIRAQTLVVDPAGTLLSRNFDADAANTVTTAAMANFTLDVAENVLANGEFSIVD